MEIKFEVGDVVECLPDKKWCPEAPIAGEQTIKEFQHCRSIGYELAYFKCPGSTDDYWPVHALKLIRRANTPATKPENPTPDPTAYTIEFDPELYAIGAVFCALRQLSEAARERVIEYVCARYEEGSE